MTGPAVVDDARPLLSQWVVTRCGDCLQWVCGSVGQWVCGSVGLWSGEPTSRVAFLMTCCGKFPAPRQWKLGVLSLFGIAEERQAWNLASLHVSPIPVLWTRMSC